MVIVLIFVLIMVSMGVFCAWMSAPYFDLHVNATPSTLWYFTETSASFF
jgi:hypothetical protein